MRRAEQIKTNEMCNKKKRKYEKSTIAKIAKRMAKHGATRQEIADHFGYTFGYIRDIVKQSYAEGSNSYNRNFLDKLRQTEKARKKAAESFEDFESIVENNETKREDGFEEFEISTEEVNEVLVVETGYLLNVGVSGFFNESLDMYMPSFCINELEKLSNVSKDARDLLSAIYSTRRINLINLKEEVLFEDPTFEIRKKRSIGVVSVCCDLYAKGFKVRLLTNSKEIKDLADLQLCGFNTIY